MAYGMLALKPWEFGSLTVTQFHALVEGARARREDLEELVAWACANVMAPHLKRPVQPTQLLQRPTRAMRLDAEKRKKEGGPT